MKIPIAADIMDRSELTLLAELDMAEATRRLLRAKLTGAAVVDADGRLCGMLTERDCLRAMVRQALDGVPQATVRDYMTAPADSVEPTAQLLDIANLFLRRPFRKVSVVDPDQRVLGQVSHRDLIRALESAKDNSFLYGQKDQSLRDVAGVHSAMERARGNS